MAIVGRYRGVVDALAGTLSAAGRIAVVGTCAADDPEAAGPRELSARLQEAEVAVVTLGPDDGSVALLAASGWRGATLFVTWHPRDERDPVPGRVIEAGRIAAEIGPAVRHLAAGR